MKSNYQKQGIPFTQVANEVLNNPEVSLSAKGMYSYLFSKPDGWQFSSDRIMLEHKDGKRAVLTALKELEDFGYLTRRRLPTGRVLYFLKHTQSAETALGQDIPKVQKAHSAKTHSAETAPVSNTDLDSNKEKSNTDSARASFEEVWKAYPRKTAKAVALKKWLSMKPDAETVQSILDSIAAHRRTRQWQESSRYVPHFSTFLNQRRWEDEVEETVTSTTTTIRV